MSKAGNFAAYQQYRPLPDTVTPAINSWANFVQQKDAQANLQRERDLNRKEREDQKRQGDLDRWAKNLIPHDSGIADLNALNGRILQESMKQYERHIPTLLKGDINDPNYLKSKLAVENLHALPDKLKQLSDQKASELKDYLDGRDSKYIIDPELDNLTKDYSQWGGGIDPETGELIIKMGDKVMPYKDAINSQIKPIPKFDMDKHAQELAKALEKNIKPTEVWDAKRNMTITETQIKPEDLDAITDLTLDGKPTQYGISYLAQTGYDLGNLETEEGQTKLKELQKALQEKVFTYLPKEYKEKFDTSRQNAKDNLAFQRQKLASDNANKAADRNLKKQVAKGKGELKETPKITDFTVLNANQTKKVKDIPSTFRGFNVAKNNFAITNTNKDVPVEEVVKSIWIDPNSDRVIIKGIKYETNLEALGKAPTKTEFTYDTENAPDEVGRFTSQLDMDIETFHSKLGNRAGIKKQAKPKTTDGKTYKGLDANGNPIFE